MSVDVTTLNNGLRVVTHEMPHLETASLGVYIASGARHEGASEHGISHLLEHMAFKGTGRRSAKDIAEEIENVGGELNAATGLESTAYYARTLKPDIGLAMEILSDILQDSQFAPDELERERDVILQEIASSRDSPEDLVYDLLQDAAFPDQPLGRSILGTADSVSSIRADDLRRYLLEQYAPARMVISAAGGVRHGEIVRHAEALFGGLTEKSRSALVPAIYRGGNRHLAKTFEQNHLVLAFPGPSHGHRDYFTSQVMSGLFGGGMSSRLFQEVREKRGLCYSIYSFVWGLSDAGLFGLHAATGPDQRVELMEVVTAELARLASERVQDAELNRSKAQIKAGLLMSLESSGSRAEQMARQLLSYGRTLGVDELIAKVEAVTADAILDLAGRLVREPVTICEVGPGAQAEQWTTTMARLR